MRNNRVTGPPHGGEEPSLTENPPVSSVELPAGAKMLGRLLGPMNRGNQSVKFFSTLCGFPWCVIIGIVIVVIRRRHLPALSNGYIVEAVAAALLVASVGVPLLRAMNPKEIETDFFTTRAMRGAFFAMSGLSPAYLDHPQVVTGLKTAISHAAGISKQMMEGTISNIHRSLGSGLLILLVVPWIPHPTSAWRWIMLVVPLMFALQALEAPMLLMLMKTASRWLEALTSAPDVKVDT